MQNIWKKIGIGIVIIFAIIGFGLTAGFFAIKWGWTNTSGVIDNQRQDFLNGSQNQDTASTTAYWVNLPEWQTIKAAILKDKATIDRASAVSGIPSRLLVAPLVVEQLRFFTDDRESFKKFFEPLKILGSQTQFSWGVMGIKEETAIQIEKNLTDTTSPFYLGPDYAHMLDFSVASAKSYGGPKQERFARMTDQHNHYYSYLYAGLYIRQIEAEWKSAGFDISNRPEIIATLYNIGFAGSKPNVNPQSGGAQIPISPDHIYSFGSLAREFYNSNELLDEFPK